MDQLVRQSAPTRMSRRAFLGAATGAAAVLASQPLAKIAAAKTCTATIPASKIGIQLFTCTALNVARMEATLTMLAEIGYKQVEHAGYGSAMNAAAFKTLLENTGLKCVSGHTGFPRPFNADSWKRQVENALIVGQRYIVAPSSSGPTTTAADWIDYARVMNRCAAMAKKEGLRGVGFHCHDGEWRPIAGDPKNRRPIDILMRYTNPKTTHIQMDIGWCWSATDPVKELRRYPGRFHTFHVKDMIGIPPEQRSTAASAGIASRGAPVDPGTGMVDFAAVFAAAKETRQPIQSYLIENDTAIVTCADAALTGYRLLSEMEYTYRC